MSIVIQLDVMLARRKVKSKDLAAAIGITEANLSLLKQGKVKEPAARDPGRDLPIPGVSAGRPVDP